MPLSPSIGPLSSEILLLFPFWSPEPNKSISGFKVDLHSK